MITKNATFVSYRNRYLTFSTLLKIGNSAVWQAEHLSLNMVVALCMFNIHKCMLHYVNQNFSADTKMYHTFLYVEHTWNYGHICTQIWRSVSANGHGNVDLKPIDLATRVRIRPEPPSLTQPLTRSALSLALCLWLLHWLVSRNVSKWWLHC